MAELKPCPCCGSSARVKKDRGRTRVAKTPWYREYTECTKNTCGLRTKTFENPNFSTMTWNDRTDHTITLLNEMENLAKELEDVAEIPQSYFDAINKAREIEQ